MCDHGVVEIPGLNPNKCYHGDDAYHSQIEVRNHHLVGKQRTAQ